MAKVKALRALALLTAMSGASVLALSIGSTSAKASEERLHNESTSTYGLLPPGSVSSFANGGDSVTSGSMSVASLSAPASKGRGNEPELENPALPGYKGGSSVSSARAAR